LAKVLVIDSDSYSRAQLREVLEEAGHEVEEASNGKLGVARFKSAPPDLVTTGIVMPEMDGLETIKALKRGYPDVKIIVVSGYDQNGDLGLLALARECGAADTLTKPVDPVKLLQLVGSLMDPHT
jgi:CheY-like chemotaxis protein